MKLINAVLMILALSLYSGIAASESGSDQEALISIAKQKIDADKLGLMASISEICLEQISDPAKEIWGYDFSRRPKAEGSDEQKVYDALLRHCVSKVGEVSEMIVFVMERNQK